jgi:hypothetical protein
VTKSHIPSSNAPAQIKRGRPIDSRDKNPRKEMSKNIVGGNSQHNINEKYPKDIHDTRGKYSP